MKFFQYLNKHQHEKIKDEEKCLHLHWVRIIKVKKYVYECYTACIRCEEYTDNTNEKKSALKGDKIKMKPRNKDEWKKGKWQGKVSKKMLTCKKPDIWLTDLDNSKITGNNFCCFTFSREFLNERRNFRFHFLCYFEDFSSWNFLFLLQGVFGSGPRELYCWGLHLATFHFLKWLEWLTRLLRNPNLNWTIIIEALYVAFPCRNDSQAFVYALVVCLEDVIWLLWLLRLKLNGTHVTS